VGRQRGPPHVGRGAHRPRLRPRSRCRAVLGRGFRGGGGGGGPRTDLRTIRARWFRAPFGRCGPGPVDRAGDRRRARRQSHVGQRTGARCHVHRRGPCRGRTAPRTSHGGETMSRILVAEDEPRIAAFVNKGLTANGFTVTVVEDGQAAYEYALTGSFDLMVLDIGLPGIDGLTVLRKLRAERCPIPVIILTARDSVQDTVAGLEGGADDYMPKPFRFEELLARVRLRLVSDRSQEPTVLTYGGLQLDLRTRRAHVGGETVDLSAREFALAETFLRHPGQVLSREQLLSQVWGYDFDPGSNVVDVYVRYLRRKLGADRIT